MPAEEMRGEERRTETEDEVLYNGYGYLSLGHKNLILESFIRRRNHEDSILQGLNNNHVSYRPAYCSYCCSGPMQRADLFTMKLTIKLRPETQDNVTSGITIIL